jgi:excisionase family DNA binding protein
MEEYLTREEVRALLKCSLSTVERLLRQQTFPVVKVGRKVLVRRSAVESWLVAQEIPAQPRPEMSSPDRLARALQGPAGAVPEEAEEGR